MMSQPSDIKRPNSPVVSVMMTTYNHEPFIAQAVESILAQRVKFTYEIVIGEDCSTDSTGEILATYTRKHPRAIRLLARETNWGRRRNYLDTFHSCKGKYIAILEGDDFWTSPYKLERQVDFLETHSDHTICFHPAVKYFEQEDREVHFFPPDEKTSYTLNDLLKRNFIATCTVMFRNHLFADFPDWFHHVPAGDWPLHILNAQHGDIGFIPEIMAVHRIHAGGAWSPKKNSVRLNSQIEILKAIRDHLGPDYREAVETSMAHRELRLLRVYWKERNFKEFWTQLNRIRTMAWPARTAYRKALPRMVRSKAAN